MADDGTPYLVMERVEGEPITAWAERTRPGVEARVRLFVRVCEAVAYAHARLVVHRDLKPSNVFVVERDEAPDVKLLDFGIAKLLTPTVEGGTDGPADVTLTAGAAMTPAYAAPEQLAGDDVTTATDVYALGVLFYELLAGRRPYDLSGATAAEAERIVRETAPPRPSAVAASGAGRLAGDLDTIVMKALAKEPERRYPTAAALADDLRRHLDGRPVEARPATVGYHASRFLRRHRAAVTAATVAALGLVVGLGAALWQGRAAMEERDRAEARFEIAREAARAMMYEVHDAVAGLPGATPARAVLVDRASEYLDRLSRQAADDPALEVDLAAAYLRLGNVLGSPIGDNLGRTAEAADRYRRGLALLDALPPRLPDSLAAAAAETEAELWKRLGIVVAHTDSAEAALDEFRRAVAAGERVVRLRPEAADAHVLLASMHINLGDYAGHPYFPNAGVPDTALARSARARALLEAIPEAERSLYAQRLLGITYERDGNLLRMRGDLDAAVGPLRQSLAIRRAIAARPDATAEALRDEGVAHEALGLLAAARGRLGEAERELLAAQAIYRRLFDADPESALARQTLAFGHLNLAYLYGDPNAPSLDRPDAARRHAAEAVRHFRTLADGDPTNARVQTLAANAEDFARRLR